MKNNSSGANLLGSIIGVVGFLVLVYCFTSASEPKCAMSGCKNEAIEESRYCGLHDMSYKAYGNPDYNEVYRQSQQRRNGTSSSYSSNTSSSSSSSNSNTTKKTTSSSSGKAYQSHETYDDGYNAMYEDDDYDWDRYHSDSDYADGVDDAMDEMDW